MFFQEGEEPYTEQQLQDMFPALYSTEPLVDLEKKVPIRRDSDSSLILRVPDAPKVPRMHTPDGVFSLTQVDLAEAGRLPSIRGAARDQRVEEVRYSLGSGPPLDIQPAAVLGSVARHMKGVNIANKPSLVATLTSPASVAVMETMFWYMHSLNFQRWQTSNEQEALLDLLADRFEEFLLFLSAWKEDVEKYYHYVVSKAVYEAFLTAFPSSRDRFDPAFKRRLYQTVLEMFIGPNFSFSFHMSLLRELFGGAEVRDLTRADTKPEEPSASVLFPRPQTPLISAELRRMQSLADMHERGALSHADADDKKRQLLQSGGALRVPVYWNKWTVNKSSSRFDYSEFDPYQICPILARKLDRPLPLGRPSCDTLVYAEPVPTNHPKSFHYNREDIIRDNQELVKKYEEKKKELDEGLARMEEKIRRQNEHVNVDAAVVMSSKPEVIRQYCDSLVSSQAEKDRRNKAMQANLVEFKQSLSWADYDLDEQLASVVPLQSVYKPIDWSMMESIRATLEAKGKLSELKPTRKKHSMF
eukprot:TRINITY_DN3320_c0_g1_i1.p1 TRINITY_DN3320_c0_g1~~TRINITY_DN3320_c0_g1_i1.p1  ORF type:complete len:596 (+),score=116.00 TRINITY_DN3320_c0_g1_i1:202-1788(+)